MQCHKRKKSTETSRGLCRLRFLACKIIPLPVNITIALVGLEALLLVPISIYYIFVVSFHAIRAATHWGEIMICLIPRMGKGAATWAVADCGCFRNCNCQLFSLTVSKRYAMITLRRTYNVE
jgi:hypothetical protein